MIFIAFFYDGSRDSKRASESTGFRNHIARFDVAGTLTFMSAAVCLLLALSEGGTRYAWDNSRIIALLTVAGVIFCSFIGTEYWRKDSAMVPVCLLRRRSINVAIWFGLCLGSVFFILSSSQANVFYIPSMVSIVDGVSAVQSAILKTKRDNGNNELSNDSEPGHVAEA
ncbi:hypothetical protein BDV26DRAFT_290991 [Aspergillus bertholletiae]|uniref:Uncharacterized protein n=1 Tax=Aspergillus bertholletiae TaxID=1226010 RepID=A0A5N7BDH2_9EURO|nr:hypothetical protein BDV26DRAFT_290991 [Aspergillus bertholletiae]